MGRPIFFLVTDRERALRELAGALDWRFGADYHILSEQSRGAADPASEADLRGWRRL